MGYPDLLPLQQLSLAFSANTCPAKLTTSNNPVILYGEAREQTESGF
jgi:hypothetical protein